MAERETQSVQLQNTPILFEANGEVHQVGTVEMRIRSGGSADGSSQAIPTRSVKAVGDRALPTVAPQVGTLTKEARRKRRRRRIGKALLIASCVIPPWGAAVLLGWLVYRTRPRNKARRLLKKAFKLGMTNPNSALPVLEEAHKLDPTNNDILAVAGYTAHNAEDYTMAWRFLNELNRRSELTPSEQLLMGHALYETGQYDRAIEALQQVPNDYDDYTRVSVLLSGCFRAKGDPDAALSILDKGPVHVLARNNDLKELEYQTGLLYEAKGDYENAARCFRRVYLADVNYRDVKERIAPADRKLLPAHDGEEPAEVARLRRLAELKAEGLLSEEEYETKKADVLARI